MLTALVYSLFSLDKYLGPLAAQHSILVLGLLFAVIFAETGLFICPFLPGDSILFIAGTVAADGELNVHILAVVLTAAAILGDTVNYAIGHFIGPRAFDQSTPHWWSRWIRHEHLTKTRRYYERYGGLTIIIGRFIPIVRTLAPFLAGVAEMVYRRFLAYNIVGATAWILGFVYTGYLFGNLAWVKKNLTLIVLLIVILSLIPALVQLVRERRAGSP